MIAISEAAAAQRRRRMRAIQGLLLAVYAVVGAVLLVAPFGARTLDNPWAHGLLVAILVIGAANTSWSTWLRYRLDGTSRAWLLAAAFAVLALVYAPHAIYSSGADDQAGHFYGPASRLALGVMLIIAMSPTRVPRVLREPKVTLIVLLLAFAGMINLVLRPDWLLAQLEPYPARTNQLIEMAALAALSVSLVQFFVKWLRTRRPIMFTWIAGVGAVAIQSALMIPAHGWQVRWWFAELGMLVSSVVFVVGTDRKMARAIDERELRLVYQPKIWLRSGEIAGVEALMRWQHPDHGLVPPDEFIPTAEATDLIAPFTMWAIRESVRQHREWLDVGVRIPIAVNVTVRLLRDRQLLDLIRSELSARNLDIDAISLELTESQSLETEPSAREILEALADLGLKIAVDDFGTGYSSLSYMRHLPVREVKLDKSFVRNVENDEFDFIVVKSTVELAQALGHKVIAEGIETAEARELLAGIGCDVGQGYHWSRPLPADEFLAWARAYQPVPSADGVKPKPTAAKRARAPRRADRPAKAAVRRSPQ